MLDVLYENLNEFRKDITNNLNINVINKKEKECGVNFPKAMNIFYSYFGNDKRVSVKDFTSTKNIILLVKLSKH